MIIFQFAPSLPHLCSFFQNIKVPNFFLPERQPPILTEKKPMSSILNNSIF